MKRGTFAAYGRVGVQPCPLLDAVGIINSVVLISAPSVRCGCGNGARRHGEHADSADASPSLCFPHSWEPRWPEDSSGCLKCGCGTKYHCQNCEALDEIEDGVVPLSRLGAFEAPQNSVTTTRPGGFGDFWIFFVPPGCSLASYAQIRSTD